MLTLLENLELLQSKTEKASFRERESFNLSNWLFTEIGPRRSPSGV